MAILLTSAVPVLLRVSVRFAEEPSAMLPKFNVVGETTRWGCAPIPVNAAVSGSVVEEVAMESVPDRTPTCVGVNVTCTVQLVLGASAALGAGQSPPAV